MKNLKRILSLVLVFVFAFSVNVFAEHWGDIYDGGISIGVGDGLEPGRIVTPDDFNVLVSIDTGYSLLEITEVFGIYFYFYRTANEIISIELNPHNNQIFIGQRDMRSDAISYENFDMQDMFLRFDSFSEHSNVDILMNLGNLAIASEFSLTQSMEVVVISEYSFPFQYDFSHNFGFDYYGDFVENAQISPASVTDPRIRETVFFNTVDFSTFFIAARMTASAVSLFIGKPLNTVGSAFRLVMTSLGILETLNNSTVTQHIVRVFNDRCAVIPHHNPNWARVSTYRVLGFRILIAEIGDITTPEPPSSFTGPNFNNFQELGRIAVRAYLGI